MFTCLNLKQLHVVNLNHNDTKDIDFAWTD